LVNEGTGIKRRRDEGVGASASAFTIRRRLMILAGVSLLPAAFAGTVLLSYTYLEERTAAASQLQNTARALSIVVDRQLGQAEAVMQALATAPSLLRGDFETFDKQARAANPISGSWIVVRDTTGAQRVNTRLPPGAPLPHDQGVQQQISSLVAGGPHVSNLIPTSGIGKPVFGIDIPVSRDGAVAYDLAIVIQPSIFDQIFAEQRLPESWIGIIIDRAGILVRRSYKGDETTGREILPGFKAHLARPATEGLFESRSAEGLRTLLAYSRSSKSGWTFAVAVPREAFGTAARRSLYLATAIGIGLIGFSILVARRIASSIARPIDGLVDLAAEMGRGGPVPAAETGLAEADMVAAAMSKAAASIRDFTATLEQRVAERTHDLAEANARLSNEIDERRRAEDQLARVQRMEAVGQLSGGIAHDFNNLLQAVIGNIDLAKGRVTDPKVLRFLDRALAASERGAKLTSQLLAFSRRQRLEPAAVDINALVRGLVEILRSTLGGAIAIEIRLAEDLWRGFADATQLELMVLNLAINARDAMPEGGSLTIVTRNVTLGDPTRPEEPPPGDYVELSVTDTGTGMPADVLARVFEPFFTTKEVGKGSGLGLSQVLGLTQQLGGGVRIDSQPGKGTTVSVYLARAE
jgi:signal transduction histidine kinase